MHAAHISLLSPKPNHEAFEMEEIAVCLSSIDVRPSLLSVLPGVTLFSQGIFASKEPPRLDSGPRCAVWTMCTYRDASSESRGGWTLAGGQLAATSHQVLPTRGKETSNQTPLIKVIVVLDGALYKIHLFGGEPLNCLLPGPRPQCFLVKWILTVTPRALSSTLFVPALWIWGDNHLMT